MGHPPDPKTCVDEQTVSVVRPGQRPVAVGLDTDRWMEGLSAAELLRQFGIDPDVRVTPDGKLLTPEGEKFTISNSDSSSSSSCSESGSCSGSESPGTSGDECAIVMVDKSKVLQKIIRVKIRDRAEAREPGANPAFHKRDLNYAKCGLVKMWLVDTGCGYDLVSKREVALMKRFEEKAGRTITFHTANGPTVTEDVANVYVKELDENITPCIFNNVPPFLTVGYRCMELGYTFTWPTGQNPYFIRPDGMIVHLTVENCIPYLVPKSNHCKPHKPTGSMPFKCATPVISRNDLKSGEPGVAAHAHWPKAKTHTKKCRVERFVVP